MFAIVDIETTGSFAAENGITEIAIVLHNGKEIEGKYETLINPKVPIPKYITSLTGITEELVKNKPEFQAVAENIFNLLKDRIFIAHNVNFDYSFIKHQLKVCGFNLNTKKLCTIRLSRKAFPNLPRYGLENLCRSLQIENKAPHRAYGDALATTELLNLIIKNTGFSLIEETLRKENREQTIPANLSEKIIKDLPYEPGVYYFHDEKGKIIYIGKAKNIKFRVVSHFTGTNTGKKRQELIKKIHSITYKICVSEFAAIILESIEIKKHWPLYNKSQKSNERLFGIYLFEDVNGFKRLAIDRKMKTNPPLVSFSLYADAHRTLLQWIKEFSLHPALCFINSNRNNLPAVQEHNDKINKLLLSISESKKSFIITEGNNFVYLVENGIFYGMSSINKKKFKKNISYLKSIIEPSPTNEFIKSSIQKFVELNPDKVEYLYD